MTFAAPAELDRVRQPSLWVGLAGLAASGLGAVVAPEQFFRAYLVAYIFWSGIALGCLAIVMLHHLSGGSWGIVIRRLLEAGTRTLPLMAVLFLPLLFGVRELYAWARPEAVADEMLRHKRPYLNVPFFSIRAAVYFAAWMAFAYFLNRWSLEQDGTGDVLLARRLQILSAAGLVVYGLTITFASIDWVMSLEPHWSSTIFGVLFMGGQALAALAFVIGVAVLLAGYPPMSAVISPAHLHDLGKLLLAFVMLWAYFAFSQYLIIWSGNLPEEIPWYLHRLRGGWQWVALALVLFHFVLPFLLLLSRETKRRAAMLGAVAAGVIVMRYVDLYWLIAPAFQHERPHAHWMDAAAPIGIGGVWLAAFLWQLKARPLLPLRDPQLEEALAHGSH